MLRLVVIVSVSHYKLFLTVVLWIAFHLDLPKLTKITLGGNALKGLQDKPCTLTMSSKGLLRLLSKISPLFSLSLRLVLVVFQKLELHHLQV